MTRDPIPFPRSSSAGERCVIVAEVAQSHDGSLGQAHAFIDAAAVTGVDVIKFQTHYAALESTPAEPWRVKFSYEDDSRYAYWRRMEFTDAQWSGLADHCRSAGLGFMSSPFSLPAVDVLEGLEPYAWKIASGEITNLEMLRAIAETRRPVIVSSGMSYIKELDQAVELLGDSPTALLQCTTAYPCPPEQIGLNVLDELRERYRVPVGLSDHSGKIFPSLAAVTLGARVIEVHLSLSQYMFGPDVPASLTVEELRELVDGIRMIEVMVNHPVDKDAVADSSQHLRDLFTKSAVARRDLAEGSTLSLEDLVFKKPGVGVAQGDVHRLLGKRLRRAIAADEFVLDEDVS